MSKRALEGLGIGTAVAAGFFGVAVAVTGAVPFWYLGWNLALAYVPLMLTYPLLRAVRERGWISWRTLVWGLLWLVWLPNSFYVLTDVMHLAEYDSYGLNPLFGVALFGLFAALGMVAGFMSLLAVHRAALRRLGRGAAYVGVEVVLALCGLATYVGRTLRWNSWDVVVHPLRLAQVLIACVTRPTELEIVTALTMWGLLSGVYAAVWHVFGPKK